MVLEQVEARAHMAGSVRPLEGVGSMVGYLGTLQYYSVLGSR